MVVFTVKSCFQIYFIVVHVKICRTSYNRFSFSDCFVDNYDEFLSEGVCNRDSKFTSSTDEQNLDYNTNEEIGN